MEKRKVLNRIKRQKLFIFLMVILNNYKNIKGPKLHQLNSIVSVKETAKETKIF